MNANIEKTYRKLLQKVPGIETADGDGVKVTRIIGSTELNMLDPFLLLDCFESDEAKDYIGGFPTHPHRGFETVTYMLDGRIRHKDNKGHEGVVESGGVQWMTAASGILHSEMPEQQEGLLKGFQLWVNLPARAKMSEPHYQEYLPEAIPIERHDNGTQIRVIAGRTNYGTVGPAVNEHIGPTYMDISLPANVKFSQELSPEHNAFVYVIENSIDLLEDHEISVDKLSAKNLGVLTKGGQVLFRSGENGARFLLVAGQPLNEPVVRGGPFVMNTKDEVLQAFADFNNGKF